MKVLVVLVLAVFTGCNANLFYADEPKPQLEQLTDAFWQYVDQVSQTADDTLQMVKKTQFGQDVNARLMESMDMANRYAVSLQDNIPPQAQEMITKVSAEADVLIERLIQEMTTVRARMDPYLEEMKVTVNDKVEQIKLELGSLTDNLDTETMRTILMQKTEELKATLDQNMRNLETQLGPYTDDLRMKVDQHLQDFKDKVTPITERVQVEATQRVKQMTEVAAPYIEKLRGKLDPYAADLQTRLAELYESFINTN